MCKHRVCGYIKKNVINTNPLKLSVNKMSVDSFSYVLLGPRSQSLHGGSPRVKAKINMPLKLEVQLDRSSPTTQPFQISLGYYRHWFNQQLLSTLWVPFNQLPRPVKRLLCFSKVRCCCQHVFDEDCSFNMSRFPQALLVLQSAKRSSSGRRLRL